GVPHGRAALAVADPPLRRVMTVLLRRAGFDPEAFESWGELAARLTHLPAPTVVLLAGLVPPAGTEEILTGGPAGRPWALVVVAAAGAAGGLGAAADLFLPVPFDPATFGAQVLTAVQRRQTPAP
ncbi:MAG TPA: hypothetical protein VFI13_12665, partial [Gemmatimonadales bacterium]|nr:hypothetical protein [Gemmatimonadales bacterium]